MNKVNLLTEKDLVDAQVVEWLCQGTLPPAGTPLQGALSSHRCTTNTTNHIESERWLSWKGTCTQVDLGFVNISGRSHVRHITVSGRGPMGEHLVTYEMYLPPSPAVSNSLVRLFKSLPRDANIDSYLKDIANLISADKNNSFGLVYPYCSGSRPSEHHMIVDAPSFEDFSRNPANLTNRFIAAWTDGPLCCEGRGFIAPDVSSAYLVLRVVNELGAQISEYTFEIPNARTYFTTRREKHCHLRAQLWEALELAKERGAASLESYFNLTQDEDFTDSAQEFAPEIEYADVPIEPGDSPSPETPAPLVDLFAGIDFDNPLAWISGYEKPNPWDPADYYSPEYFRTEKDPLIDGSIHLVEESPGGATVWLEITPFVALTCISLPYGTKESLFIFSHKSDYPDPFSKSDITRLKNLTRNLASSEEYVRYRAVEELLSTTELLRSSSTVVSDLLNSLLHDYQGSCSLSVQPSSPDWSVIAEWSLEGYHTICASYSPKLPQRGKPTLSQSLILGVSPGGAIRAEFTHTYGTKCIVTIPCPQDASLHTAKDRINAILLMFEDCYRYSWDQVLSYLHKLSKETPGGTFRYEPSITGITLPQLSDRAGITALSTASSIVTACLDRQTGATEDSFHTYTSPGNAMALIRYPNTPLAIGIKISGSTITELGCYTLPHGCAATVPSDPIVKGRARLVSGDSNSITDDLVFFVKSFRDMIKESGMHSLDQCHVSEELLHQIFHKALKGLSSYTSRRH